MLAVAMQGIIRRREVIDDAAMTDRSGVLVLVEPICRGSRLQALANAVAAEYGMTKIVIATRPDYCTDHYVGLIGSQYPEVQVAVIPIDLSGAWFRPLSFMETMRIMDYLEGVTVTAGGKVGNASICFMAMDEYMTWMYLRSLIGGLIEFRNQDDSNIHCQPVKD